MENRKKGLYTARVCRFCLSQDEPLLSLFEKKQAPMNSIPLSLKILSSISVEVFPSEKMPPYICRRCNFYMDIVYNFKNICREADKSILDFVQTGAALEPIVWPPSLVKVFRYGSKVEPDVNVVEVEGGATIEVSQSMSDSEDDVENVYNVKIKDGTKEGASACVKVVTSKDPEVYSKDKKKDEYNPEVLESLRALDSDDIYEEPRSKPSASGRTDGCWACDECISTFPLQQLLELHKMQKHRARNIACEMCDAKFFSKYDLSAHLVKHSQEMPFECSACEKRFKRLILLKRHEKLIHSDLPQVKCAYCPASFLSMDKLSKHQTRHSRAQQPERKYPCDACDKSFYGSSALSKHHATMHDTRAELACEYCPERFTSIAKLARHVRTHAGERPYPCKHCDKTFTKSHHYTRHLRIKHNESQVVRGQDDEYKCEQCESAFPNQDELIYHSAIHATQNLTCPLCQEKFEDVDAVTAHIKSHVTGMEFMCDFCELVFTSKEKLDNHIDLIHEDELQTTQDVPQDESSMEVDAEEEFDDSIQVKDEGDHMVVEIKKPDEFMLPDIDADLEDSKINNTNSEESEAESGSAEEQAPALVQTSPAPKPPAELPPLTRAPVIASAGPVTASAAPVTASAAPVSASAGPVTASAPVSAPSMPSLPSSPGGAVAVTDKQTAAILRKAEEIKQRKAVNEPPAQEKKEKPKVEISSVGVGDKSLRLLEKDLQELQRTKKREESPKTPAKSLESLRTRGRAQIHTSTPKLRSNDDKKSQSAKSTPIEKKMPERRAVKENKKPEESKETKVNSVTGKEDKETKTKEDKEAKNNISKEDSKEKSLVKNGANKSATEEPVRRSSRPSKVKDYAQMVNNSKPAETTPSDDDSDDDADEEYEAEKAESRPKTRRGTPKAAAKAAAVGKSPVNTPTPKKRGRPRKDAAHDAPAKLKKEDTTESDDIKHEKMETDDDSKPIEKSETSLREEGNVDDKDAAKRGNTEEKPASQPVTPTGPTLKKVPINALPPGVKPIPLPAIARTIGPNDPKMNETRKKMVKIQKIVMTKAEVDAMKEKGLVEMKDGTMILKQGVKLPADPNSLKSTLVGQLEKSATKESPSPNKAAPTRCELDDV